MGKDDLEVPSDNMNGSYSNTGRISRGTSSHNIPLIVANDPESMLMQRRIEDVENGFRQLDRLTDEIDYDIETFESRFCYTAFSN